MNKKTWQFIVIVLLMNSLLAACQVAGPAVENVSASAGQTQPAGAASSPTPQPTVRPAIKVKPSPTIAPTVDVEKARAEGAQQAVRDYFAALEKEDFAQAANQLSTFSLMVAEITHGDAAAALNKMKAGGARWSGLQIMGSSDFNEQTMLVQVRYTLTTKETNNSAAKGSSAVENQGKDSGANPGGEKQETRNELWPVREENGAWRYNWNNLIDYRALQAADQTMNGVTVKPVQLRRYSDRTQLVMLVQNRTTSPVVFGQVNEILGTFHFGDQAVEAEKTRYIFNPLRSARDVILEAKGLYEQYPDSIEIRRWKNYNVKPWYVFELQ